MKKNKIEQMIISTLAAMSIFTLSSNFAKVTSTAQASIYSNVNHDKNDIWKTDSEGRFEVQQLDNNNTIYYAITSNRSNAYYKIWQRAANDWNNLGVINIQQVSKNDPRKEITLSGNYHYMSEHNLNKYLHRNHIPTQLDGVESNGAYSGEIPGLSNYAFMGPTKATLSPASWDESYSTLMVVAQHEFGHALGFDHYAGTTNGRHHIMNAYATSNALPLGNLERQLLQQHYEPFIDNADVDTENFQ